MLSFTTGFRSGRSPRTNLSVFVSWWYLFLPAHDVVVFRRAHASVKHAGLRIDQDHLDGAGSRDLLLIGLLPRRYLQAVTLGCQARAYLIGEDLWQGQCLSRLLRIHRRPMRICRDRRRLDGLLYVHSELDNVEKGLQHGLRLGFATPRGSPEKTAGRLEWGRARL